MEGRGETWWKETEAEGVRLLGEKARLPALSGLRVDELSLSSATPGLLEDPTCTSPGASPSAEVLLLAAWRFIRRFFFSCRRRRSSSSAGEKEEKQR